MQHKLSKIIIFFVTIHLIASVPAGNDENAETYLKDEHGYKVCVSSGCVSAAATVIKNLDKTVEPCDDFFQFACGGFIKETDIPDDKSSVNYFNIIGDQILTRLRILMEEPSKPDEPKPFSLIKKFYKICLNTKAIESDGLKTVKDLLVKLGGWAVLDGPNWKEEKFDWKNTTYEFRKAGIDFDSLLYVSVGQDTKNSSKRVIDIDQANTVLDREYLVEGFENEVVKAYYDYLVDVAVIFGADTEVAKKEMKEAVEFEMKLAQISLPKEELRNKTALYNPMSVKELQERFPSIPWIEYLNNIVHVSNCLVCPYDTVVVSAPKYVMKLETLLERTPKRVLDNYLKGQTVLTLVRYLTKELRNRKLQYTEIKEGTRGMEPRWRECVALAGTKLNLAEDALYVRNYFNEDAKRSAGQLVSNLRKTFIEMLKKVDWMDDTTREKAIEKARVMNEHIAYPQELLDDKELEKYYSKLEAPTSDNLLEFSLRIRKFKEDISFAKLPLLVNKTEWTEHSSATTVNAYYNSLENSIQLSAGILQGVFFDNERPNYMNYGSMGFAIGHEITHGFDDVGRQYDKNGELHEWWAEKTKKAFAEKAQCMIDQYSNITVPEVNLNLNGINNQGENIADNGGVKEAYLAYNSWLKNNGEEPRLPGVDYTPKQLFWISLANLWCTKERTEYLRQEVLTNPHAPQKYRVLVPLRNSEQFSTDFNCPIGSKMNPVQKCQVW